MLALASILSAFATIVCLYFLAPERAKGGRLPQWVARRAILGPAAIGGLVASLALAVTALGWAAGIGLWLAALMATGVGVVSIAGNHPAATLWSGCSAALAGLLIAAVQWSGV